MKLFLLFLLLISAVMVKAQQVDSICFHLYTDSLKKGTYNYINIDGRLNNNHWLPLTDKEISFTASAGRFNGNSLFIDTGFTAEKVTVKAILKTNPAMVKETTIYIKKGPDNERLRTSDEIMHPTGRHNRQ